MWIILSFISSFFTGISDAFSKDTVQKTSVPTLSMLRPGWAALFLLPLFINAQAPHDVGAFWKNVACAIPLEMMAGFLFHTGLKVAPISSTLPFMALTPAFLLIAASFFLKELPPTSGIIGICLIVIGAIVLQYKSTSDKKEFTHPWEKFGPYFVLGAGLLFSMTAVLAKKALDASSTGYFSSVYFSLISLSFLPFQKGLGNLKHDLKMYWTAFARIGICDAIVIYTQFKAFTLTHVATVIAIKRLSLLISVVYGWIFLNEKKTINAGIGAILMVGGAILLTLIRK